MKIYLAGPIDNCEDSECRTWREKLIVDYPEHQFLDPMRRDARHKTLSVEEYVELVERDKADILASDLVLVNLTRISVGTSMEIMFAYEHNKPVILANPNLLQLSPWHRYHVVFAVQTLDLAMDSVSNIGNVPMTCCGRKFFLSTHGYICPTCRGMWGLGLVNGTETFF